jgi:hypothetical protein
MIARKPLSVLILASAAAAVASLAAGCNPHVQVEGGDKPIKIDMTVTLKVDQQLDQFFAFEKKYEQPGATTAPATNPTTPTTQPVG